MKTLLSTLFLAGNLVLNSYGQEKDTLVVVFQQEKNADQNNFISGTDPENKDYTEDLEKYNLENKQIYKDFAKFVKENGRNKYYDSYNLITGQNIDEFGGISAKVNKIGIYIQKTKIMENKMKKTISFRDSLSDGLFEKDFCIESIEAFGLRCEIIKKPYNLLGLNLAKEYTSILKEIMDETKKSFEQDSLVLKQKYKEIDYDFSQFVKTHPKITVKNDSFFSITNIKLLNKQIKKNIKKLSEEKKPEYEEDYLKSMVKIMYKSDYKDYRNTLYLKLLAKEVPGNKKSLEELGQEQDVKSLINMLKTTADNLEYKK